MKKTQQGLPERSALKLIFIVSVIIFSLLHVKAQVMQSRGIKSFDTGWAFQKNNTVTGPEKNTFDDSAWRRVDVPHEFKGVD